MPPHVPTRINFFAPKGYYNFPSISVDDTNVNTSDRDCFAVVGPQDRDSYAEVTSSDYVVNFQV